MYLWKVAIFIALNVAVFVVPGSVAEKDCEDGWKKYDQYCFKLEERHSEWKDASSHCKRMGGHLASIHSKDQNEFFEEFTNRATDITYWWIGMYDHVIDGIFEWDDGSVVDYTNWKPGEPAGDYYDSGDCAAESFNPPHFGMWYVLPCNRQLPYICQKKIISKPIIQSAKNGDSMVSYQFYILLSLLLLSSFLWL